jgi:hypothetical protein
MIVDRKPVWALPGIFVQENPRRLSDQRQPVSPGMLQGHHERFPPTIPGAPACLDHEYPLADAVPAGHRGREAATMAASHASTMRGVT